MTSKMITLSTFGHEGTCIIIQMCVCVCEITKETKKAGKWPVLVVPLPLFGFHPSREKNKEKRDILSEAREKI